MRRKREKVEENNLSKAITQRKSNHIGERQNALSHNLIFQICSRHSIFFINWISDLILCLLN